MHEVDGHKVNGAELAIDSAHKLVDDRSEGLVLLHVASGENG